MKRGIRNKISFATACLCGMLLSLTAASATPPTAVNLRCEYLIDPLGIDAPNPRLTWVMLDVRAGARQTFYQVLVSTDSMEVVQGKGDVWNSGVVQSNASLIKYKGRALQAFTKYYWTVSLWDMNKKKCEITVIASFETGMMGLHNWKGAWISDGADVEFKPAPYFRKTFNASKKIKSARAYMAVAGLYELYINGERIGDHAWIRCIHVLTAARCMLPMM